MYEFKVYRNVHANNSEIKLNNRKLIKDVNR